MNARSSVVFALALFAGLPNMADAHFLWLVAEPAEQPAKIVVYFGEEAIADDPDLLDRVASVEAWLVGVRNAEPQSIKFKKGDDGLEAAAPKGARAGTFVLKHTFGVVNRGDSTFLLNYYAKTYPSALPGNWKSVDDDERLPLEVTPSQNGKKLSLSVMWKKQPAKGATLVIHGPGLSEEIEGMVDENGKLECTLPESGLYSIRARWIEETAGKQGDDAYDSVRHYSTLSLQYHKPSIVSAEHKWPALDRGITSFGAAIDGDWLYVYGGHFGTPHHYSSAGQSGEFHRLNLRDGKAWETLAGGPKRTGLAMVPHGGKIYRLGGFEAMNGEDDEQDLHSRSDFSQYDPKTGKWTALPDMPEGRSSHDAAVVGDVLYVVGGWEMEGDEGTEWHDAAWSIDLSADKLAWKKIATPPFHRRALALAAQGEKLYVIGGMQEDGGPTTKTAVYDPASDSWTDGPRIMGGPMDGFGSSAFACGGQLIVTTMSGSVQQLAEDGSAWRLVGQLKQPRFFHRIVPHADSELTIVGGADMSTGKIETLERLPLSVHKTAAP